MSIRFPTQGVTFTQTDVGASSVAGGVPLPFNLPQDTDNVVVKFQASITGGGASATFQTSDDGGTNFYDVARTSVVSNANATTAEWLTIPTIGGTRSQKTFSGSILSGTVGSAAASTLGQGQMSGLPILGQQNRLFLTYTGNFTASSIIATVKINQQSATA